VVPGAFARIDQPAADTSHPHRRLWKRYKKNPLAVIHHARPVVPGVFARIDQPAADTSHPHRRLWKLNKKNPPAVIHHARPVDRDGIVKVTWRAVKTDKENGYLIG